MGQDAEDTRAKKLAIEKALEQNKGDLTPEQLSELRGTYAGAGDDLGKVSSAFETINKRIGDIRAKNTATRQALDEQVKLLAASPGNRLQQNKVTAFFGATGAQGALRGALAGGVNPTNGNING
jgi:hypothetical protein